MLHTMQNNLSLDSRMVLFILYDPKLLRGLREVAADSGKVIEMAKREETRMEAVAMKAMNPWQNIQQPAEGS